MSIRFIQRGSIEILDGFLTRDGKEVCCVDGTNYKFAKANGSAAENGQSLVSLYNELKNNGITKNSENRFTLVCAPGNYSFTSEFNIDEPFIDIVSLDGNTSVNVTGDHGVRLSANDVFIKGFNLGTREFKVDTNLDRVIVSNVNSGEYGFGGDRTHGLNPINLSGTYIDCSGLEHSFAGGGGAASGVFIRCKGLEGSFGGNFIVIDDIDGFLNGGAGSPSTTTTASGEFTDCVGGHGSFGSNYIIVNGVTPFPEDAQFRARANGKFTRCIAGNGSFGSNFIVIDDIDGFLFRGQNQADGEFIESRALNGSFGSNFIVIDDIDGFLTSGGDFGNSESSAAGVFERCDGGKAAFGNFIVIDDIDGFLTEPDIANTGKLGQGLCNGIYNACIGGQYSFGGGLNSTVTGRLTFCRVRVGQFPGTVADPQAYIRLSIDGSGDIIDVEPQP
jgi:hypothetical protein